MVAEEEDIEKVFQSSSKVVAVHSEDEAILNINKKLIKNGDVHSHPIWRSAECAISSTRRIVRIAKDIRRKLIFFILQQKKKLIFYHSIKVILLLRLPLNT